MDIRKTLSVIILLAVAPLTAGARNSAGEDYFSCRCCCDRDPAHALAACLYEGRGDSLADVIRADEEWKRTAPAQCPKLCEPAKLYRYCDGMPK